VAPEAFVQAENPWSRLSSPPTVFAALRSAQGTSVGRVRPTRGARSGSAFDLPIHARVDPSGEETPGVVALKAGGP
jgi:hypothetical protein